MTRGVVDEMPDESPNNSVPAFIDLCGLNDLLLECRRDPPIYHVARTLVLV